MLQFEHPSLTVPAEMHSGDTPVKCSALRWKNAAFHRSGENSSVSNNPVENLLKNRWKTGGKAISGYSGENSTVCHNPVESVVGNPMEIQWKSWKSENWWYSIQFFGMKTWKWQENRDISVKQNSFLFPKIELVFQKLVFKYQN